MLDYGSVTVAVQNQRGVVQTIPVKAKEFQLLEYFMQHPNQILNRDQLMNQIWGIQDDPVSNVVPAQIRLLCKKLAEFGCENLLETIYGLGYRLNLPHVPK